MPEPSAVCRQLGKELAAVRRTRGHSQRNLAELLGTSQSTVARVESGKRVPDSLDVLQAWLRVCRPRTGYPAGGQDRIRALFRAAAGEVRSWTDHPEGQQGSNAVAAERNVASASSSIVQTVLLPVLVQTEAYARRALAAAAASTGMPAGDLDAEVAARIARQSVLHEPGRRFAFIVAERLLHFVPGPSDPTVPEWECITRPQLERLADVATLDTVRLAILPDAAGHVVRHPFVLRVPADGSPPSVTVELIDGREQELREASEIAIYRNLWAQLWSTAAATDPLTWIRSMLTHGVGAKLGTRTPPPAGFMRSRCTEQSP